MQVSLELNLMHVLKTFKELFPGTQLVVFISFPPEYFFPFPALFFGTLCSRVMSFEPLDLFLVAGVG